MTYKDFFEALINYYGGYEPKAKGRIVAEWVKNNVSEKYLQCIYERIVETEPGKYKYTPDIAAIAKAKRDMSQEGALTAIDNKLRLPEPDISREEALSNIQKVKQIILHARKQ